MTVEISNTELNHSFNTWRLNTNYAATVLSNNVVTVWREGSANRGGLATGNGHIIGTMSATELKATTIAGGNTIHDKGLILASNTTIGGSGYGEMTFNVQANTTISGNVIIDTSGSEIFDMGDVSRLRMTGSSEKEVMFSRGNGSFNYRRMTFKDMGDLSSNSAHIILSAANATFSDNGDSPHLRFSGAAGLTDKVDIFLAADATNGDSDLYIKLVDNAGDSAFVIADAANNRVGYITSGGNLFAGATQVNALTANGNVLPGTDDTYDLGSSGAEWKDLYIDGVANIDELSVATGASQGVSSSLIPKTDNAGSLGSSTRKWDGIYGENLTLDAAADIAGGLSVDGTSALNGVTVTTLTANGTATFNGDVVLGDASTDTITVKGNFANVSVDGAAVFNGTTTFNDTMYINGNVVMGDQITDTFTATSNTDLQGNVKLGSAGADEISILGQVDSDIIPVTDNGTGQYNIGGTGDRWHGMYANNMYANNIFVDNDVDIAGDITVGGTLTIPSGGSFSSPAGSFTSLTVTGTTSLNGTTNLGDASGDNINVNGSINTDIIPKALTRQDLGSSASKWQQIYANNVTVGVDASIGNDLTVSNDLTVTGSADFNSGVDVSGILSNDGTTLFGSTGILNMATISAGAIANAKLANYEVNVEVTDGGTVAADDDIALGGGIQLDSGEGLSWTKAANNAYVISGEDASTSNKGVAKFSSDNFSVSSGTVSIKNGGVASAELADTGVSASTYGGSTSVPVLTVNSKGQITSATTETVAGVNGLTYTQSNNNIRVSTATGTTYDDVIDPATTTSGTGRGVASFDSGDFDVSSGHVSLKNATSGAVLSISGTAKEVTATRTNGSYQIGLPDDVSITAQLNVGENLVVAGNLIVSGTTTTVNTETIKLADNLITLNSNYTGSSPSEDGGIEIERGTQTNRSLIWDESASRWTFTNDGSNYYNIPVPSEYDNYSSWTIKEGNGSETAVVSSGETLTIDDGTDIVSELTSTASGGTIQISHADTSTLSGAYGSSGVSSITVDGRGHVTAVSTTTYDNYSSWTAKSTDTSETITVGSGSTVEWSGNNGIETNVVNGDQIDIKLDSDLRSHVWYIGRDTNDYYHVNTTRHDWYLDGVLDMRLENDGDLHVDGSVIADSSTTSSDRKLKGNIKNVENALDKVTKLNGVEFDWKKNGERGAGVIAQDVLEVLPQAVKEVEELNGDDTYLTVQYDALHALLIESIKELKAEIDELKANK